MYKKIKEKKPYNLSFRDVKKQEIFSINAPFWNIKEAKEYANNRLQEEKTTCKSLYSVHVKQLVNKRYY